MNLGKYLKEHEASVLKRLPADTPGCDWQKLMKTHERLIGYAQQERLIHLMVTLAIAAFLLITLGIALVKPMPQLLLLLGLFFILLVPYLFHYHFLENTVQRWYALADRIEVAERNVTGSILRMVPGAEPADRSQ